jgi:hypothetical protein
VLVHTTFGGLVKVKNVPLIYRRNDRGTGKEVQEA